jgi:hypothetical protein
MVSLQDIQAMKGQNVTRGDSDTTGTIPMPMISQMPPLAPPVGKLKKPLPAFFKPNAKAKKNVSPAPSKKPGTASKGNISRLSGGKKGM